jgi:hypothetical protein
MFGRRTRETDRRTSDTESDVRKKCHQNEI